MIFPVQPLGTNVAVLSASGGGGGGTAPTLDSSPSGGFFSSGNTNAPQTNSFQTTQANDIIVAAVMTSQVNGSPGAPTVASFTGAVTVDAPHDLSALNSLWARIGGITSGAAGGSSVNIEFWWALSTAIMPNTTSQNQLTVNLTGTSSPKADGCVVMLSAWNGCGNLSAPWDVNASLPKTVDSSHATSVPFETGISTTATGTVILSMVGAADANFGFYPAQTVASPWTLFVNHLPAIGTDYTGAALSYNSETVAQTGLTTAWQTSWKSWMALTHALVGT